MIQAKINEASNLLKTIIEESTNQKADTFSKFSTGSFGGFHFNNGTAFIKKDEMIRSLSNAKIKNLGTINLEFLDIDRLVCVVNALTSFDGLPVIFSSVFRNGKSKNDPLEVVQLFVTSAKIDSSVMQNESKTESKSFAGLKISDSDFVLHSIRFDDIYFIRCNRNYLYFFVANRKNPIRVRMTLHKILEMLPASFMKIQRGVIVNKNHIECISRDEVLLRSGEVFHVSRDIRRNSRKECTMKKRMFNPPK